MSDKNIYKKLSELCSQEQQLDYGSTIGHIDDDVVHIIATWLRNNVDLDNLATEIFSQSELYNVKQWQWTNVRNETVNRMREIMYQVGTELVNKDGKYNVRLKKYLRKQYNVQTLTTDDYCKISTLIGDWKEKTRLRYEFVDRFDWESGDFGDDGSCYWGDRAAARDTLEHYHALAIRFYKTDEDGDYEGVGRAWVAPILHRKDEDGAVVIFNRYGVPREMEDVVAAITKIDRHLLTTKVRLTNQGSSSDVLYANGDAWVISYEPYESDRLDLQYRIHEGDYDQECNEDRYYCDNCGDRIDEDDVHSVGDDTLCEHCYCNHAGYCEICGDSYYNTHLHDIAGGGGRICEWCTSRYNYVECDDCGEFAKPDYICETTAGRSVCEGCASDLTECEHCNLLIDTDEHDHVNTATRYTQLGSYTYHSEVELCDECNDDHTFTCEVCHQTIYAPDTDESVVICDVCKEKEIDV